MNLNEFDKKYCGIRQRATIEINCDDCGKNRKLMRHKARENIESNGRYRCASCAQTQYHQENEYTDERRRKISNSMTGIKRSDETKKKMSEAKKEFFKTEKGKALKKRLSLLAAQGHAENKFENAKRNGWYPSEKAGMVFYGSSYELRLCHDLDRDESVETYETQIAYEWDDRGRCLDFLVTYKDGRKCSIEVKPLSRLNEQAVISQLEDSQGYAQSQDWEFMVCTEEMLDMTDREIRVWADKFRNELGSDFDFVEFRMERDRKKAKKHYDKKIAEDKVPVDCKFCNKTHDVLRVNYDKNIKKNGRYICMWEGGSIAGKKPKKKKVNPYAAEGKKQCTKCEEIKKFEEFGLDKSRSDGYASRCKECRNK